MSVSRFGIKFKQDIIGTLNSNLYFKFIPDFLFDGEKLFAEIKLK